MRKIYIFPLIILFVVGLSSCFGEQRKIEGLTDEIYRECSGIWTLEKYVRNERISGPWDVSWGNNAYGSQEFSILIDLHSKEDIDIWPDMGGIVVKKVEKIDDLTIKMIVDQEGIFYQDADGKSHPAIDIPITMHLLKGHRMWIDTKIYIGEGENDGSLIGWDGPEYIYQKVSGPDVQPVFTKASDPKEFLTPP